MEIRKSGLKFKRTPTPLEQVVKVIIHHAVSSLKHTIYDIHTWHLNRGWLGVGYNFVIDPKGVIWEGRGEFKVGSHSGKEWNGKSIGICLIGNFEVAPPTKEQYQALAEICNYFMKKYKLNLGDIIGHREVISTACPGKLFSFDILYKEITKLQTPPVPKKDSLTLALEKLKTKGKLNDPTYWNTHARPGGKPNPEYVAQIIKRFAESI